MSEEGFSVGAPAGGAQVAASSPGASSPGASSPGVGQVGVRDPGRSARLRAQGLVKRFGGVVALDNVGLHVEPGEVVGLLGPNGAGKTTLFNCLLGMERPDRGTVWVNGEDVTRLAVYQRARLGVARTFQRVELFAELSVREQLAVAARTRAREGRMLGHSRGVAGEEELVEMILVRLGLESVAAAPAASLSLGRTRLVELGRALATGPSVILADEPSSGLDDDERETLALTLPQVTGDGTAVLLIEHDLELVRDVSTRLYVLEAGAVVVSGPTAAVLDDPVVARIYGRGVPR